MKLRTPPDDHFASWLWPAFLFAAILVVHLIHIFHFVPPTSLFNPNPMLEKNYGTIYMETLKDRSRSTQYSLKNGQPRNLLLSLNWDARGIVLTDRFFRRGFSSAAVSIRIIVFLALLSIPVLVFGSMRLFHLDVSAGLIAMAMSAAGFANSDYQSFALLNDGWPFLLTGPAVALFAVASLFSTLKSQRITAAACWSLSVFFALLVSPLAFITALPAMLAIYVWHARKLAWPSHVFILMGAALAVTLHISFSSFPREDLALFSPIKWLYRSIPQALYFYLTEWLREFSPTIFLYRLFVIGMALAGLAMIFRKNKPLSVALSLWLLTLFTHAVAGQVLPILNWVPQDWILAIASTVFLPSAAVACVTFFTPLTSLRSWIFLWLLWFQMTCRIAPPVISKPIPTNVADAPASVIGELRKLPLKGRILIEMDPDSSLVIDVLPLFVSREFLGGPRVSFPGPPTGATTFVGPVREPGFNHSGQLFDRPLESWNSEDLLKNLRLHNVSHIAVYSLQAKSKLDRHRDLFRLIAEAGSGPFQIPPKELVFGSAQTYRFYEVTRNNDPK